MIFKGKRIKDSADKAVLMNLVRVFHLSKEQKSNGPKIKTYPDGWTQIVYEDGKERWTDR